MLLDLESEGEVILLRDAVEASLQIPGDDVDDSGNEHAEFLTRVREAIGTSTGMSR